MKLLAFAATSSQNSINKKLVTFATTLATDAEIEILDLNDYEMPIYSIDKENASGIPTLAQDFYHKIGSSSALIIAFAEHNGTYTAAFKNIYDWMSRINAKVYQNKPMVMLATSPGGRGASNVLTTATASAARFGGELQGQLSVPNFEENYDHQKGIITNDAIVQELKILINKLQA